MMDGPPDLRSTGAEMTLMPLPDLSPPFRSPALPRRFLSPDGFQWGMYETADGARLRWGHLAAATPRATCVLVGGYAEFIEKYFETIVDLTRLDVSVWCLDWRGQGRSTRPK